jgi:hypothetical protein
MAFARVRQRVREARLISVRQGIRLSGLDECGLNTPNISLESLPSATKHDAILVFPDEFSMPQLKGRQGNGLEQGFVRKVQ